MGRYPRGYYYTTRANLCPTVRRIIRNRMTNPVRKALCEYQRDHPSRTPKRLQEWLLKEHQVDVSLDMISQILRGSSEYLPPTDTVEDESEEESESSSSEAEADQEDGQNDGQGGEDEEEEVIEEEGNDEEEEIEDESDTDVKEEEVVDEEGNDEEEEMEDESDTDVKEEEVVEEEGNDEQEEMEAESNDEEETEDESDTDGKEEEVVEEEEEEMEDESDNEIHEFSDLDLFDCPVCAEPLSSPVYHCENGHVACSSCCLKTRNKCPSCSLKIGHNRCRFVEKVLESFRVSCKNRKYGCEEMLKYCDKFEHENMCPLSPCSCPESECNFKGSMAALFSHFCSSHVFTTPPIPYNRYRSITLKRSQRHLTFRGEDDSIFVLNRFNKVKDKESIINVVRIAPSCCEALAYDIRARDQKTSILLHSSLENIPEWEEDCHPQTNFLIVPHYCTTSQGQLHLEIRIQK